MNNEEIKEAIETLERNYPFDRYVQLKKAVDVAIEALHTVNSPILTMKRLGEFQADAIMQSGKDTDVPDDDSISRQDAIDMIYGCEDEFGKDVVFRMADYIRQLPSVQPKVIACGSGELNDETGMEWVDNAELVQAGEIHGSVLETVPIFGEDTNDE